MTLKHNHDLDVSQSVLLDPYTTNIETARIAIWAFDILKYPYLNLQLLIVDRPDWDTTRNLAASLGRDDYRIQFIQNTLDIQPLITWKVALRTVTIHRPERDNYTVTQPSAVRLAQETHRILSVHTSV